MFFIKLITFAMYQANYVGQLVVNKNNFYKLRIAMFFLKEVFCKV